MRTIENNKNPFEKINDADDRFTNSIVEWWLTHVMNMTMKLSVNAMTPGTIVQRASQKSLLLPMASGGILMSKISSVSAIANTPSQKHSIRALGFDSTTGSRSSSKRLSLCRTLHDLVLQILAEKPVVSGEPEWLPRIGDKQADVA